MAMIDVFNQDPFTSVALTTAVEKVPYLPSFLGDLNLFTPRPVRTKAIAVESRQGTLSIIQTSPRGAPLVQRSTEKRDIKYVEAPRIATEDTLWADEIQSIREFGSESELIQVQNEVARRLMGPAGLLANVQYTWENMRLGAIQGLVKDADGSNLVDWSATFGVSLPAEIDFNFGTTGDAAGALVTQCNTIVRGIARAAQGAFTPQSEVYGLCGDQFWDTLINHTDVRSTYLNWQAAEALRAPRAFESFRFGGINWVNYRGSDDGTTMGIATDKVKFFPANAPGVFEVAFSPAETFDWVNTPGKPYYVIPVRDTERNAWWKQEVYSYPLFICTRPGVLFSGKVT